MKLPELAGAEVRSFAVTRTVGAPAADVWRAWTSSEEIASWWGPADSTIDLRVGGPFEILFSDDAPYGQRGSEACIVLGYVPGEMISFTWNAPPHLALRSSHTWVVVTFASRDATTTDVRLVHTGFGLGEDWDAYMDYFRDAWAYVLGLLVDHWDSKPAERR